MLRQRFLWPIIIVPRSGDGTHSRSRLTGDPMEWYVQILGKEPFIRHKCGNRGRWTIFGRAARPIRVSKSMGLSDFGPKPRAFVRSRNNSRSYQVAIA